ncbi:MAG: leucine-rich repeat domain-containing protein [Candidatus Heimdallarchaeota archaeon]
MRTFRNDASGDLSALIKDTRSLLEQNQPLVAAEKIAGSILADVHRASVQFSEAASVEPACPAVRLCLGMTLLALGKLEQAIESVKEVAKLDKTNAELWDSWRRAIRSLKRYKDQVEPKVLLNRGMAHLWLLDGKRLRNIKDYQKAAKQFFKALDFDPENSDVWYFLGYVATREKKESEFLEKAKQHTKNNPNTSSTWTNYGALLVSLDKPLKGITALDKARDLDPTNTEAWCWSGFCILEENPHRAEEMISKAIELDPTNGKAWYFWGLKLGGDHKYKEAIEKFERAADLIPDTPSMWYQWGRILFEQNEYEEAIIKLKKAGVLHFDEKMKAIAYVALGIVCRKQKKPEDAIKWLSKATDFDPENDEAWGQWAWALSDLKRFNAAQEKLTKALELNPEGKWLMLKSSLKWKDIPYLDEDELPSPYHGEAPADNGKSEIIAYKGVPLIFQDAKALLALEKFIGEPILPMRRFAIHSDASFGFIPEQQQVRQLALAKKNLKVIPEPIKDFSLLQCLDLRSNEISEIPGWLLNLNCLQSLDLSENKLSTLPEEIHQISSLTELHLGNNELKSFPETLGLLHQLTELWIDSNQLATLPESIGQLRKLRDLSLPANKLKSLPESFAQLRKLRSLSLAKNQLKSLPDSFCQLASLQRLWLGTNQLTRLPELFGTLVNLKDLYLQENRLTTLPKSFGQLVHLETLLLENNQLGTLPVTIKSLEQLCKLDLTGNPGIGRFARKIGDSSKKEEGQKAVREFLADFIQNVHKNMPADERESVYNGVVLIEMDAEALNELEAVLGEPIPQTSFPTDENAGFKSELLRVKRLSLPKKHLSTLPESFGNLTQLEYLNLRNNRLAKLPESVGKLINLIEWELWENQLVALPESIGNLTNLEKLDLEANKLKTIPDSIGKLSKLRKLLLYRNPLTSLPESLANLEKLDHLSISGNSFKKLPEPLEQLEKNGCSIWVEENDK